MSPINLGSGIKDIWRVDMEAAFDRIQTLVETFNFVAIDTEFPGVVLNPNNQSHLRLTDEAINFLQLRGNVNNLKIIQLGLSFSNEKGEKPSGVHTYQFNFEFDLQREMYAEDAINLLTNAGLDFKKHASDAAIRLDEFGEMLMSSGLVLNDEVHWISFHGMYDFAYPLHLLMSQDLPDNPIGFFDMLLMYFPQITDLKYQKRKPDDGHGFHGGLQTLAYRYGVTRYGKDHQAGSDALLTMDVFFSLEDSRREKAFDGHLYGLSQEERLWYDISQCPQVGKPPTTPEDYQWDTDFTTSYEDPRREDFIQTGATLQMQQEQHQQQMFQYQQMHANGHHHHQQLQMHQLSMQEQQQHQHQAAVGQSSEEDERRYWNRCGPTTVMPGYGGGARNEGGHFGQPTPYYHGGSAVGPPLAQGR